MSQESAAEEVYLESRDEGRISVAVLNRLAKRNAMSPALSRGLLAVVKEAIGEGSNLLLLRSAVPGMFCAGFDISYLDTGEQADGQAAMAACFAEVEAAEKVTICLADGGVLGGGVELFMAADLRLATARTTFRLTPARLGVVYSTRGLARFVRTMGVTASAEMLLAARTLTAEEALRVGLVTRIVPDEAAAFDYCREVARLAPLAQRAMKATLKEICGSDRRPVMNEEQWRRVETLRAAADASEDQREGRRAFLDKRQPQFTGR